MATLDATAIWYADDGFRLARNWMRPLPSRQLAPVASKGLARPLDYPGCATRTMRMPLFSELERLGRHQALDGRAPTSATSTIGLEVVGGDNIH